MVNRKRKCPRGQKFSKRKNRCVERLVSKAGIDTPDALAGLVGVLGV